jgi:hypothetical protein
MWPEEYNKDNKKFLKIWWANKQINKFQDLSWRVGSHLTDIAIIFFYVTQRNY